MKPVIVYESSHLLVVAKPFGMPSQRDKSGDESLLDWATDYLKREPNLLHRLDRPTGGLVAFGKTKEATKLISQQFQERAVKKVYLAAVTGDLDFEEIELKHFIGKLPGKNFVRAYDKEVRNSKKAHLSVRALGTSKGVSLLEIHPFTGRRHQIRAQLRTLKLSILGDHKYGKAKIEPDHIGISLWAHKLELDAPDAKGLNLEAEPPGVFPWNHMQTDSLVHKT